MSSSNRSVEVCVCGHYRDDHHGVYWFGGGSTFDECEWYGSNEQGGMMPVHEDGQPCPFAGIWFRRGEDGVYRALDGTGRTEDECQCELENTHRWTAHCGRYKEDV